MAQQKEGFRRLPDAELEIMQIIWEANAPVTSADVLGRIQPPGRWATTTVLNFLGRLVEKGFLRTRKQGKCNVYSAVVDHSVYLKQASAEFLEKVYGNSLKKLVSTLYQSGVIEDGDLLELRDYIDSCLGEEETERQSGHGLPGERKWKNWYRRHFSAR